VAKDLATLTKKIRPYNPWSNTRCEIESTLIIDKNCMSTLLEKGNWRHRANMTSIGHQTLNVQNYSKSEIRFSYKSCLLNILMLM